MNKRWMFPTLVAIAGFSICALMVNPIAAQSQADSGGPAAGKAKPATPPFPDLEGGLKKTKGCLGVETARTASGKNVIFAWFEDKAAVERWYYSDMHQGVMKTFFPGTGANPPLNDVPDDVGPIMAIASITMADEPKFDGTSLPISQIAIELYTPLTGGIYLGGRFAPDSLKVKDLKNVGQAAATDK